MNKTIVRQGGVYRYPGTEDYALFFNNSLYFIEERMPSLDVDMEHRTSLNDMELVDGYNFACKKTKDGYEWQIRDSGAKHTDRYILAKGWAGERCMEQVNKLCKSF